MDENSIFNDQNLNNLEFLFNYAETFQFGQVHIDIEKNTRAIIIIAIHNTKLGPALGGCRFIEYTSRGAAIIDALRLARGMSYKAAIAGLPLGGGKAVIIKPPGSIDREAIFSRFGQLINNLNGQYITAKDSGSEMSDMDVIARHTPYVTTTTSTSESIGDPSYFTARGVLRSIEASVSHRLNKSSLADIHVAIQGAGAVAKFLAKELVARGARISVCDVDSTRASEFSKQFNATVVDPSAIYDVDCDVFSPCALGATINHATIPRIKAKIIAGCANNQLERRECGIELHRREIIYAPDYLANSGGLIFAASEYFKNNQNTVIAKVDEIHDTLLQIYQRSAEQNEASNVITGKLVEEMIY